MQGVLGAAVRGFVHLNIIYERLVWKYNDL